MRSKLFIAACVLAASMGYMSCNNSDKSATDKPATVKAEEDDQEKWACLDSTEKSMLADSKALSDMWNDESLVQDSALSLFKDVEEEHLGRKIPYDSISPCLDKYKEVMKKYGIDESDPSSTEIRVKRILKITHYEMFRGTELYEFLTKAARLRGRWWQTGKKKNLAIFIVPGIYTDEFVAKYNIPKRLGRMGVFLITKKYKRETENSSWTDDGFDDYGFNFGGIKP